MNLSGLDILKRLSSISGLTFICRDAFLWAEQETDQSPEGLWMACRNPLWLARYAACVVVSSAPVRGREHRKLVALLGKIVRAMPPLPPGHEARMDKLERFGADQIDPLEVVGLLDFDWYRNPALSYAGYNEHRCVRAMHYAGSVITHMPEASACAGQVVRLALEDGVAADEIERLVREAYPSVPLPAFAWGPVFGDEMLLTGEKKRDKLG